MLPRDGDWSVFPCGMPPGVTPRGTPPTPHPNAYASYIEIAAAQNLYINNMFTNVTLSNSPLPLPRQLGQPDTCYVLQRRVQTLHYTSLRCRVINHMHFPILTTPIHAANDNFLLRGVGCAPPGDASYHASLRHASLRRPVGNTALLEGEPCKCIEVSVLFFCFFTYLIYKKFLGLKSASMAPRIWPERFLLRFFFCGQ